MATDPRTQNKGTGSKIRFPMFGWPKESQEMAAEKKDDNAKKNEEKEETKATMTATATATATVTTTTVTVTGTGNTNKTMGTTMSREHEIFNAMNEKSGQMTKQPDNVDQTSYGSSGGSQSVSNSAYSSHSSI
ncbi:hypothetical protein RFI_27378, partial [Reticulomyxa filosa]